MLIRNTCNYTQHPVHLFNEGTVSGITHLVVIEAQKINIIISGIPFKILLLICNIA